MILGVGTGEGLNEVPSTGMVWPDMKERFARMREAISLIRKLWSEDHLTFEGEYYKTQSATIYDKPGAFLPIYVAGAGPQVAKYAGRMADGFICTSGKKWDLYTETLLPNVEEGLKLSPRPKPDFDRMIEMKVSFDTDKQRAMEDTRIWAALALTPRGKGHCAQPPRNGTPRGCAAVGTRRQPLDRLIRSGRAYREDQALHRHGLPPPRVPCPRQ